MSHRNPFREPVSPVERQSTGDAYLDRNMLDDDEPPAYVHSQQLPPLRLPDQRHMAQPLPPAPPEPARIASARPRRSGRLIMALDFGTTFTGVAFATTEGHHAELSKIEVLQDWTPRMSNLEKVPSVKSYTTSSNGAAQWGSDVSANAITMVNQKLELELQDNKMDELDLTLYVLRGAGLLAFDHVQEAGPNPEFTCKSPDEIVTDYLGHIFECAYNAVNGKQLERTKTPVDLVITVPVSWSYQAYNSLFRAIKKAGFNNNSIPTLKDTILVTEPEAAAYFTARDLKDRGSEFLHENQCFVLCDAGGGTVDAVAYQVKKLSPFLELEKATEPSGRKCGSALIDTAFKRWLRDNLGRERYAELDPVNASQQRISPHTAESGAMRELIKRFISKKVAFSNLNRSDIKIDLPPPLNTLTVDGLVNQGELTIKWTEMKTLMDSCVSDAVDLILGQMDQVGTIRQRRTKNVFLVGGFGASPYLQQELEESLDVLGKKLRRPDPEKSMTAVVQGGCIYGIEKSRHTDVTYMRSIMKTYGIVRDELWFEWLIKKDDLVLSNQTTHVDSMEFWHTSQSNKGGKQTFQVFYYNEEASDEDDPPPEDWQTGQHEVAVAGSVQVDFKDYLNWPGPHGNATFHGDPRLPSARIGPLKWRLILTDTLIEADLLLRGKRVAGCQIKAELSTSRRSQQPVELVDASNAWYD